ncbi:hypothetical protein C723_0854 [Christiangramia flava JLT2011]|uniref:Uncharacterized protein n=1 Tax=Christiangramia flava JLT2011 TaxID=1229726 RepID=A0A1L7I4B1_9FLAO|nr:hypothetical protein GRFL_1320 [Christiangramia flava JLT2011]OSS40546.1 hypothetical protein C723_0854 [Christiangramia flava JLT2011]
MFAAVLKTHLYKVKRLNAIRKRHIGKPVKNRQFITSIGTTGTVVLTSFRLTVFPGRACAASHKLYILRKLPATRRLLIQPTLSRVHKNFQT